MNDSGISVIIPAYNAERYLAEAIDSVLRQTLPPKQVIVVDDGSTDGTAEVAKRYGAAITFVMQKQSGVAPARNHGLRLADQPLIAFLDADDRYLPDKLAIQYRCLLEAPQTMLCLCRTLDFISPDHKPPSAEPADLTPQFRPGQAQTWLVRREVFEQVGVFDTNFPYAQGSELYSRMETANLPIVRIPDLLVERRLHDTNSTRNRDAHLDSIMTLMHHRIAQRKAQL